VDRIKIRVKSQADQTEQHVPVKPTADLVTLPIEETIRHDRLLEQSVVQRNTVVPQLAILVQVPGGSFVAQLERGIVKRLKQLA